MKAYGMAESEILESKISHTKQKIDLIKLEMDAEMALSRAKKEWNDKDREEYQKQGAEIGKLMGEIKLMEVDLTKTKMDEAEKRKGANEKSNADQTKSDLAFLEAKVLRDEKDSKKELDDTIKFLDEKRKEELKNATSEGEIALINAKYDKQIFDSKANYQKKLEDLEKKEHEKSKKDAEQAGKTEIENQKRIYSTLIQMSNNDFDDEKIALSERYKTGQIKKEEYEILLTQLQLKYATDRRDIAKSLGEDDAKDQQNIDDIEIKAAENKAKAIEKWDKYLTDSKKKLKEEELNVAMDAMKTIQDIAGKESAIGKAAFIVQQGISIAKVWMSAAEANAIVTANAAIAATAFLAIPIYGEIKAAAATAFGASMVVANNIMAGISTGLIWAQTVADISKWEKGSKDYPGGPGVFGDGGKGRELITLPSGDRFLTPDTDTILNLPKHSEVTPAHMVEQELAETFALQSGLSKRDSEIMSNELLRDINKGLKVLNDKPVANIVFPAGSNYKKQDFIKMVNTRYRNRQN